MILTALGFILSLSALNVDAFIVKQNVQREIHRQADTPPREVRVWMCNYFLGLSEDAIPPLVSAFHSKSLPVSVKEEIGAALTCMRLDPHSDENIPGNLFISRVTALIVPSEDVKRNWTPIRSNRSMGPPKSRNTRWGRILLLSIFCGLINNSPTAKVRLFTETDLNGL